MARKGGNCSMYNEMRVVMLGTGAAWPSRWRNVSAIGVQRDGEVILMDCGEGTQRQFQRTSLSFMRISTILITHFHGDHILGLPGLVQTMALHDRTDPLIIYGPKGARLLLGPLLYIGKRTFTFDIDVVDISPGETIDRNQFTITPFPVDHDIPALGYVLRERDRPGRFDRPRAEELGVPPGPLFSQLQKGNSVDVDGVEITPDQVMGPGRPGRVIVYTGDTRPCQTIRDAARDADLLIHDCLTDDSLVEDTNRRGHTTVGQAVEMADSVGVRHLVLTHISQRYASPDDLMGKDEGLSGGRSQGRGGKRNGDKGGDGTGDRFGDGTGEMVGDGAGEMVGDGTGEMVGDGTETTAMTEVKGTMKVQVAADFDEIDVPLRDE